MEERCVRATISGRVQGVGFRWATREAAVSLGARGYVRNLPDRRVEAVFEGSESAVDEALAFVRKGPAGARVTDVAVEPLLDAGYTDFQIRY